MEEKIEITETETQMEDGSISVHCSARGPQGEHVTMAYVVGTLTLALAPELRALVIQQHQNYTRAAIEERVRELRAARADEIAPMLPVIEIPPLAGRATRDITMTVAGVPVHEGGLRFDRTTSDGKIVASAEQGDGEPLEGFIERAVNVLGGAPPVPFLPYTADIAGDIGNGTAVPGSALTPLEDAYCAAKHERAPKLPE